MRFTAMPNAVEGKGIWAASGVNAANVGMIPPGRSQPRVLGADSAGGVPPRRAARQVPGGIGEEDGVSGAACIHLRGRAALGQLLQTYGTLRDERHRFAVILNGSVVAAGDTRRPPLDRPPCAG